MSNDSKPKRITTADKCRLIWRSLWIQVLLNYKTMQGAGYLHILWPWIKDSEHRKNQVKRASGFLNGHPVFSSFALGAMLKRLSDGEAENNPKEFDQWRESLAGPLGMVGDALIWARWKPIVLAAAVFVAGLGVHYVDLSRGIGSVFILFFAAIIMLVYNVPIFILRWWGLDRGYELGKDLLSLGNHSALGSLTKKLDMVAAFAAGLVLGLGLSYPNRLLYSISFLVTFLLLRARISVSISALTAILLSLGIHSFIH